MQSFLFLSCTSTPLRKLCVEGFASDGPLQRRICLSSLPCSRAAIQAAKTMKRPKVQQLKQRARSYRNLDQFRREVCLRRQRRRARPNGVNDLMSQGSTRSSVSEATRAFERSRNLALKEFHDRLAADEGVPERNHPDWTS